MNSVRSLKGFAKRVREHRKRQDRRSLMESLEQRHLMAGPNLIGIQPNEGSLLVDGSQLTTAPRELVFRFDDNTAIDPTTLDGIRITRRGADNSFEAASALSDVGTRGAALVEFVAVPEGTAGEGISIQFTTTSRPVGAGPLVNVVGNVISVDINSNPQTLPTQVRTLISAIENNAAAKALVNVFSFTGSTGTAIDAAAISGTSVTLRGANVADAVSDLGTSNAVRVRFLSAVSGPEGRNTKVVLERANFGGPANPLVLVSGNTVTVRINSNPGNETTVTGLLSAINSNAEASQIITAVLEVGSSATLLGNRVNFPQTLSLTGADDIVVNPGYVGIGNAPNEVVFRFAETLPQDTYQIDIFGSGALALTNVDGEAFNDGLNASRSFTLNLGPQVLAVVPEPVRRTSSGLSPEVGVIEVHFNDDTLNQASAVDPRFYQLIYTKDTVSTSDDRIVYPTSNGLLTGTPTVTYDSSTNIVRLTFPGPLARMPDGSGGFIPGAARLRVGNEQTLPPAPVISAVPSDPGDSFATSQSLGQLLSLGTSGTYSVRLNSEIQNTTSYDLNLPGADAPGVRNIRPDDPSRLLRTIPLDYFRQGPDSVDGISTIAYNFPSTFLGDDLSTTEFNLISEFQKERVREVLSLFSQYLGVQFVERNSTAAAGNSYSIVVGDPAAILGDDYDPTSDLSVVTSDQNLDGINDLVLMDFRDFEQSDDDQFGGEFFRGAMLAIGQLLGYGYADGLPQPVSQSTGFVFSPGTENEPYYPSVSDIVNGQYLFRPDSTDIDLYSFTLNRQSKVSIQTVAERLLDASLLDTQLRLYRNEANPGDPDKFVEVAQNDDYFSNDSLIELSLAPGRYQIGVSASGNHKYNPVLTNTGFGGRSEGAYELHVTAVTDLSGLTPADSITDLNSVVLDGDGDGSPGGIFDFWFVPADPGSVIYVDKAVRPTGSPIGNGTIASPFSSIASAIASAAPGATIRVVGNGGTDGRLETPEDAFSYQIGFDNRGVALPDGATLDVPKGVRLIIDAGAVFKMRTSRIGVGSTAPLVDRSDAAIQVLGTPTLIGSNGFVARDSANQIIPGSVYFTSYNDTTLGRGNFNASVPAPFAGDWGGIDIRSDLDNGNTSRRNRENEGVFLNHIQFADMRFGGGQVRVDGRSVVVSPIELAVTRATIINSRITQSADAAIAATPDTFKETRFDESFFQQNGIFTPSVMRVGPDVHGNTVVDNTINGLFLRIATRTGESLQPLTVMARFDDTDIVHVITENLVVKGTPGGPIAPAIAPSNLLISAQAFPTGGTVPAGTYVYSVSFASPTSESLASGNTIPTTLSATGRVELSQLPTVPAGSGFTIRRLYRATVAADGTVGTFMKVADLNATDTSYIDRVASGNIVRPAQVDRLVARPDASLKVDPGTIIKMNGARIDLTFGADLIAEGTLENPVVITSLKDKRFGTGGTFDTNSDEPGVVLAKGDWAGLYVGPSSSASLDRVVFAGAGGQARVEGGFAAFNAIEVHQGELRVANSRFEDNSDGREFLNPDEVDRVGRSTNASGTIFVRGSQPTIVNNDMINGNGPVITIDVNSLVWNEVNDRGRSRGQLDSVASIANSGPLVSGNRLGNNQLNGMEVRGGQVATEVVWDDVDIVHIVRNMIEVPNQHIYGGLRLQSDARGSLVVKFQNTVGVPATLTNPVAIPAKTAGIVAGGTLATAAAEFVDIADRIGGSLQIVGQPDFPVVLTALVDDTIGAGFSPTGQQSVDTDNNGIRRTNLTSETDTVPPPPLLPLGPEYDRTATEVDNGTRIDNDVDPNNIGFFEATPVAGGEVTNISVSGAAGTAANPVPLVQQNFGFLNTTFVDIDFNGINGSRAPIRLSASTITQAATLISPDRVQSTGLIDLASTGDQLLAWTADTFFVNNRAVMYTTLNFSTVDGRPFNGNRPGNRVTDIRIVNYLDIGIGVADDDVLYSVGTPGQADFRAYVVDQQTRIGFSHGGIYTNDGLNQVNASFNGWEANTAPTLLAAIAAENTQFTPAGTIDQVAFPPNATPPLGAVSLSSAGFGPGDVSTAFSWALALGQTRARVTSLVEFLPTDPGAPFPISLPPSIDGVGSWNGITIREAANDRNVYSTAENETRLSSLGQSNAVPSLSQFLGELAPNAQSGDEYRRLGFVVNGSILESRDSREKGDVDVYSFIAEAGSQVWLDLDRTDLSLDAVLELIDANGQILILSDDSLRESRGDISRLQMPNSLFQVGDARALNVAPVPPGSPASAYQDLYSINPRDPGMRVVLPGNVPGERNLYHVRVRPSNASGADRSSLLDPNKVLDGLTTGNYQLQIRLSETDESVGTQIRYGDVRYAVNGVQVIGGPLRSPLSGDEYEKVADNNTIANAQPLGLFSVAVDGTLTSNIGPLASDRLAKSVGGALSSATDVDWYQFDVNYQNVTRDDAALYLSTIFDVDYVDGFGRGNVAIYVFNAAGQLILVGQDSNIADDQPTGLNGVDADDLSRGSAGTRDPFIGATELAEGNYFVAIVNQSQIPNVLNQFNLAAASNPLLRLEPIDSVTRIAEDRIDGIGGGTANSPTVRLLFDGNNSVVPYTLNDMILYTLDPSNIGIANPFAGGEYGNIGGANGFRDFAFYPNGELFGYNSPTGADLDVGYAYFRLNSENGTQTNIGLTGIDTFHVAIDQAGVRTVVDSNEGITVEAMTFDTSFGNIAPFRTAVGVNAPAIGFFVGNRPIDRSVPNSIQNQYSRNILYAFNPQTGQALNRDGEPNRQVFTVGTIQIDQRANGAGTQIRERGFIETGIGNGVVPISTQLVVPAATQLNANGSAVALLNDGDAFEIQLQVGAAPFRIEMDSGPLLNFATNPSTGAFPIDGLVFSVTSAGATQVYELDSGPVVVIEASMVVDGATVRVVNEAGVAQLFEFNSNGILNNPAAVSVSFNAGATSDQLAQSLATAINGASFGVSGFATPGQGRVDLSGDSTSVAPTVSGSGLSVAGAFGSTDANIPGSNIIRVRENFTGAELAQAVAAATGGAVAGNLVNFRSATAVNVINLAARNIVTLSGTAGVTTGSTGVRYLVSDSAEAIAIRIQQVINGTTSISSAGITATTSQNVVIFQNAVLDGSNNSVDPAFAIGNLPPGGTVTGIAMIGSSLYAVSDAGGLYVVNNPTATVQGRIGNYVPTSTALIGLNFSGLSAGPQNIEGGRFANLLFGVTASGDLYAFDTAGRLQPVFAGGATNVNVGGGTVGIDFSTLDFNLWHTTQRRADDPGHGINPIHNGTRGGTSGGTSYYFGFEGANANGISAASATGFGTARQDGQNVVGTYNFPGGAKGAIESNPISLVGYSADDLPTLYFNYFLETDGFDTVIGNDRDAFRVYAIDDRGVEHLLTTNNEATLPSGAPFFNDEFDDPTNSGNPAIAALYDDEISVKVQPTFDNTDSWRQARVSLADFAGQANLRLRVEFSTGASFGDQTLSLLPDGTVAFLTGPSLGLRTIAGNQLVDGQTIEISGRTFEIDLGTTLSIPSGVQIENFYTQAGSSPTNRVIAVVGGVTYVLNDGTRTVNMGEVDVRLQVPGDQPLSTFTADLVATRLATAIQTTGVPATVVPFSFLTEPNDELLSATPLPTVSGNTSITGTGAFESGNDVDMFRLDVPAGATVTVDMASVLPNAFIGNVRMFNAAGVQLTTSSSLGPATFTATSAETIFIGFSSNSNVDYSPIVAGTGSPGVAGDYTVTINVEADFGVIQTGAKLQITGGVSASGGPDGLVIAAGAPGTVGIPVVVDASMTANQVALVLQDAIARQFSGGVATAYPVAGSTITLAGLSITNPGPFGVTGFRSSDAFGSTGVSRAIANNFEGVYVDDFIIGFAERGEIATGVDLDSTFVTDISPTFSDPARPVRGLEGGTYQLEIRDGSEYVNSLTGTRFRTFDTNDRLSGGLAIQIAPAASIVDGATFQLTDGVSTVTFEFDVEAVSGAVSSVRPGNVRIAVPALSSLAPGDDGAVAVARAVIQAINNQSVRSLFDVAAVPADGVDSAGNSRINLFGDVFIQNATGGIAQILARSNAGQTVRTLPATSLFDGATFEVQAGSRLVTFEFDLESSQGISDGASSDNERILITSAMQAASDGGLRAVSVAVASAIRSAFNLRGINASVVDGGGNRIDVTGPVTFLNYSSTLASVSSTGPLRGDQNRDRSEQGVILIENSRFAFSSVVGIDIVHDTTSRTVGIDAVSTTPSVMTYPRNLVELNSQRFIPGVVVHSNVVAFNQSAGIQITGIAGPAETGADSVPFDRIINNTIVGGVITAGADVVPETFVGVDFPAGAISFADAVVSFTPGTGVSSGFDDPQRVLGAPDCLGRGDEPADGQFTLSMGSGGVLVVQFTDNLLTGSDDARPDLIIFETGEIESVRVAISRDGVSFIDVGVLGGVDTTIDLDRFGFGRQDRFAFVRLTDLRQGTLTSGPVGADIDAIGALSTAPANIYLPGSQGIVVRQNAAPTLLNNVLANSQTGLAIDGSSSLTVVGGTSYYRNAVNVTNNQSIPQGSFADVISPSLELFVDPTRLAFAPRAGVPIIDSSIDSLEERSSLFIVRSAIGLPPSPIIAPRLDVNGQLRVDDPAVETPPGIGERVFKDRGAEDRADDVGPRAVLISPRGFDLGLTAGQVATAFGTVFDAFDIQLIDGIGPADPTPGVGIDDSTVTSNTILVTRDGVPLVEGIDYRFGYDASNNIIRLTPIAGIWEVDSTYIVRLLDASDSVLRFGDGSSIADGAITTVLTSTGVFRDFEVEQGITISINPDATITGVDGQVLTVFDGTFALNFELNNNTTVGATSIPVNVATTATAAQIATALAAAIETTALNVTVNTNEGILQLLGASSLTTATPLTPLDTVFAVSGAIGTRVGFGIGIPATGAAPSAAVDDGQTFVIRRGVNLVREFELDFGNGILTPGAIPVAVGLNPTLDQIADAIVRAVGGAGLGLAPINVGQGRVVLGGDANYSLDVSNSGLVQLGAAGQQASVPVVIPIDATLDEVVAITADAISGAGLPGVTFTIVGDRLILEGVAAVSGLGEVTSPIVRDKVGNLLQSGTTTGRTELTIFVGGGFDFGDAPTPYRSSLDDGGPRVRVQEGFSLGASNTPDADAIANDGDQGDDGVVLPLTFASGFNAEFTIEIDATAGSVFYVDAWFDWNGDGAFTELPNSPLNEVRRFRSPSAPGAGLAVLGVGINTVSLMVPAGVNAGPAFARFRLSTVPNLGPNQTPLDASGNVLAGEIEDYAINLQSNQYQNGLNNFDVNRSGSTSPLDALNIINLLAAYSRHPDNPNPGNSIDLTRPETFTFMTDIVNGRFLPDTDGNGRVQPLDALRIINEIARAQRFGNSEGEGESFTQVGDGLLASPLTVATTKSVVANQPVVVSEPSFPILSTAVTSSSVFDNAEIVALDDILDNIANDDRSSVDGEESSVDAVFSGLGLGL